MQADSAGAAPTHRLGRERLGNALAVPRGIPVSFFLLWAARIFSFSLCLSSKLFSGSCTTRAPLGFAPVSF